MHKAHIKLFNTESRHLEEIAPLDGRCIRLYTCGPTVYNYAHIGNYRTYVFEDLLKRTLKFFGFQVKHVMNITDVDDKTIKGALHQKTTLEAYTKPYTDAFFEDLKILNIEPADAYPKATEYLGEMIKIIQGLLDKGIAYQGSDKSIYFAIRRFPGYGRLSHLHLDELQAGACDRGINWDEYEKENASDFVLWKAYDSERDGYIFWESPFGPGRPGWHIECSAMAMKLLGESIDIHVGGVDNIFPHHENEIAQSEAFTCKTFARLWMHAEHLLVDHKKMSKSLGNFYTLRDLIEMGYTGQEVRYMLLQTHYRSPLNFTLQGMDAARHTLERLSDFIVRLRSIDDTREPVKLPEDPLGRAKHAFDACMCNDLNISGALAGIFDLIRTINSRCDAGLVRKKEAQQILEWLESIDQVLGVLPLVPQEVAIPQDLEEALANRQTARAEKNWAMADHYRDLITSRGYFIEDTPSGARLKKKD